MLIHSNSKIKILAISGSTRKESSNESLLKYISETYQTELELKIFNGIDKLPHFNPDLDDNNPPQPVKDFRAQIEDADAVLFCTPEYVFSLPGSLKNAIDWNVSTTLFSKKPVAFIIVAASGEIAYESLFRILSTLESKINENSCLLLNGVKGKIGKGGIITDGTIIEKIDKLIRSFINSIVE